MKGNLRMTDEMKLEMLRKINSIELTNGRKYEVGVSVRSITLLAQAGGVPWFRIDGHHSVGVDCVDVNGTYVLEVRYGL